MDNFDEFEFKPITEGLGFHKKTQKSKLDISDTIRGKTLPSGPTKGLANSMGKIRERNSQFTKLSNLEEQSLNQPQEAKMGTEKISLNEPDIHQPQNKRSKSPNFQLGNTSAFIEEPRITSETHPTYKKEPIAVAIASIFFDAIVVVGLTGLFLFATFLIAKVDPITVIQMVPQDPMTGLGLVALVFSVLQGYLLISRSFFASTLGEWAFEVEVGTEQEQNSAIYPIRIILRSLVTIATGLILLPILSLVLGQDVAGHISGVSLRRG